MHSSVDSMSTLIPPSQRRDVFPPSTPHFDALNRRHRREELPRYPESVYQRPYTRSPAQVKQLPIRPVPLAGKVPQPVPLQLRPGPNPYPDRRSSRLTNISTKSSPELRRSMPRRDAQSGTASVATVRFGPAHGQPEFRPVSIYDSAPAPFAPAQRMRTASNPSSAQRPISSSSNGEAWCSTSSEVPNFSRKIPIKKTSTTPSTSSASDVSSFSPPPAARASQQSTGNSPPRTYTPATTSPLGRPKSMADIQSRKASTSQLPAPPPKVPGLDRPPSCAPMRAEDAWRSTANAPAFSRNALKNSTIIMPMRASDLRKSKDKEQNLQRLKRGSKSNVDLRTSAQSFQTSPRKSTLIVTNPDVVDIARPARFERPPSCLRNSIASSHSPQQPRAPKKVRIADDPTPRSPSSPVDSESLLDVKASFDRISGTVRVGPSYSPPPRASSVIATPKYVRRRSNSLPNAGATMQKKDVTKMSDWLESSSDELKRFLCPTPSPPSNSPNSSPPRPQQASTVEKKASVALKPVPLLRFSKSGGDLKLEYTRPPMPPLPKLDTRLLSSRDGPPPRPRLPSPIFGPFFMERTNSGVTTSSSSSNDTCSTDRSVVTIASSKTSIDTPSSTLMHSAAKASEKQVQLPPPPKSSADLWRQIDDEEEVQQPRTIIPQAPVGNPPTDSRRKDSKLEKRPTLMTKLVSGLGFVSKKTNEPKRVRCNCGTTTVNLHYKKHHTSNGDGAGLL